MRRMNGPLPEDEGATMHPLDTQEVQTPDGADDVEYRIDRTDLVEMNLLDGRAMDLCLRFRQREEHGVGALFHVRRRVALLDDRADVLEMSPVRLRRYFEIHLHARDPSAHHGLDGRGDAIEPKPRRKPNDEIGFETHRDQRAEGHVSGDSAEWLEERDSHPTLGTTRRCQC